MDYQNRAKLDGRHSGDYLRLKRLIERGSGFQLVIAAFTSFTYRQRLIARLDVTRGVAEDFRIPAELDPPALIDRLSQISSDRNPIHVVNVEAWLRDGGVGGLVALNYRREYLAETLPTTLVFWVEPTTIAAFASEAPDLWAWRAAVLDFTDLPEQKVAIHHERVFLGNAELAVLEKRLADIRTHLSQQQEPSTADADLLLEASDIEFRIGRLDAATEDANSARQQYGQQDHRLGIALAWGRIADILQARGELDEALRIRREEQLPVFERLGNVRSRTITLGQIADVLQARGELDEALRIRREEELPVYERLGDVHSRTVTLGQIADVLEAQGELDEALRIRREEELPVFERLGDVRERTVTLGKIADILQARGELDEALRIRREEQLPVFERLGDVHSRTVTLGKIADILQARGELDEALRIRREEQLPVFERLGNVRERTVTLGKIADILQARGELDEALRIRREEQLPVFERLGDVRSRAVTLGKVADILESQGELDEALALQEKRLPMAEGLGDIDLIAHIRYSRAQLRLQRGDLEGGGIQAIQKDLAQAYDISRKLGRPDAISAIGWLLAQVLGKGGLKDEALTVLAEVEAARRKLGDDSGLLAVAELQRRLRDHG